MAIATIGRVLGKAGLAYLKKNKSKIKKELDSPESKQKIQEIMDKAKKGLGNKMLTGGQAKIDEKDFAVLRAEKAKGRGMGLQDEKVQPGKVQKAVLGKIVKGVKSMFRGKGTSNNNTMMVRDKSSGMGSMLPKLLQKAIDDGTLKTAKKGKMIKAKRGRMMYPGYLDTFTASSSASTPKNMRGVTTIVGVKPGSEIGKGKKKFNKRRTALAGAKQVAKSTRLGKIVLPIAAAGVAASQYLKGKMKKDKNQKTLRDFREQKKPGIPSEKTKTINSALNKLNKKMGGGMMQKPMGYKSGMGPGGAGGSMAGRPGGRRPMQQGPKGGIGSLPKKRSSDDLVVIFSTKDGTKKIKRSDLNNMSAPKQKMGGGMMQKPMGYSKGTMIKARGCKLGRTRPTKIT